MDTISLEDKLEMLANKAIKEINFLKSENEHLQGRNAKFQQERKLACSKLKVLLDSIKRLRNDN